MLSDSQVKIADFNGDGLVDVGKLRSQSLIYWPSMGFGLFDDPVAMSGVPQMAEEERHHVADLNGDGLADIVYVGISNVGYWLNRGDGSFDAMQTISGTPSVDPVQGEVQFADMNGNGTTDIVWVDLSGGPVGAWQYLDPIGDQYAGLITRVDNGLGKAVTIEYESSTAYMIRAAEAGSPWTDTLPFPIPVIKRVVVDDGLGMQMVSEYDYRDGYFVAAEEEFRGFAGATKTDVGDASMPTLVTRWTYDVGKTAEALKGRVLSEESYDDVGYIFSHSDNDWSGTTLASGENGVDVVFPHLDVTVASIVEGTATPRFTRRDMFYDDYGNVTDDLNHGEVASIDDDGTTPMGGDEVFVHREFAINESAWILDRVSGERVRDGEGNRVSESRYYYDGAVFNGLPLGQVDRGNLVREERWLDTEDRFVPVTRNRIDEWGNVTAMLDANGGRREIFYDAASHTYPVRERIFIGDGAIDYTVDYDAVFGKISSLMDPNGAQTKYSYDALGRLSDVVKPGDSQSLPTTSYSYDLASPVSTVTVRAREASGEAGTQDSYIYYDGLGRVRAKVSEAAGGDFAVTEAVAYNARGGKSFIANPFMCGESCKFYGNELLGNSGTSMIYDATGRLAKTVHPDGAVSRTVFHPLEEVLFDENDNLESSPHYDTPTTKRYDGQGRLVSTTFAKGGEGVTTAFVYDAAGNLTSVVDSDGNVRTQTYDSLGRMVAMADPNAGQRSYIYDDVGNMTEKVKPTGERIKFLYEATSNRVLAKNLVDSAEDDSWEVVYHYDSPSSAWEGHGRYLVGKLAWVEDGAGAEYYGYDALGRMVAKRRDIGDRSFVLSFEYDAMDRRKGIAYPDGTALPIAYDERGLVKTVGSYLVDRTYNAAGQVVAEVLGDGISRSYSYDGRQRLTDLSTVSTDGGILQQFHYDFDSASNITAIDDLRSVSTPSLSQKQNFTYDDLYRLTSVDLEGGSINWAYDDVGNIVGKTTTLEDQRFHAPEIRYGENGAGPYAVTTHGDDALGYDGNGNLSTMPGQTLAYDAEDRLTSVLKDDGTVVEMVYGFDGQRRIKRVRAADGDLTETLYVDPVYEVRGDTQYKYIWVDDKRIARAKVTTE
jgi:YD repeat-containing protein